MRTALIDTLRYADRLKDAGFEPRQAEAMSRALKDELGEGFATKNDVDGAVDELKGEIARRDARLDGVEGELRAGFESVDARFESVDVRFDAMDARFDAMDAKFDARFGAMDARFGAMDAKFGAMDAKFDALSGTFGTQSRYVFLVLALIAALGLYNAAAPKFPGTRFPGEEVHPTEPARAVPAEQTPARDTG